MLHSASCSLRTSSSGDLWEATIGLGDELLGSGIAKGAAARGELVAFGDGHRIRWHSNADIIYRNNPNVLRPGEERSVRASEHRIRWVRHYPGARLYHAVGQLQNGRWTYNRSFKAEPGELFFDDYELAFGQSFRPGFAVVEPHVKNVAPNKRWPVEYYHEVVPALRALGLEVVQFHYGGGDLLPGVTAISTRDFRLACAALARAAIFVGPEGGLHHAAAAVGIPAVVIFGGFTHPRNTGYDFHVNLFHGDEPCGIQTTVCPHCIDAMKAITPAMVLEGVHRLLNRASLVDFPPPPMSDSPSIRKSIPDQTGAV